MTMSGRLRRGGRPADFSSLKHPVRSRSMPATPSKVRKSRAAAAGTSPADVVRQARAAGVQIVDVRFTDLPGTWQHFSIPVKELEEDTFTDGLGFDGSSIRGFQ